MSYVIHKFTIEPHQIGTEVQIYLEPEARVLYFDRDSRSNMPALWVLRPCSNTTIEPTRRRFLVVATGDDFEVKGGTLTPHGLVRIGDLIFHGFEIVDERSPLDTTQHEYYAVDVSTPSRRALTKTERAQADDAATAAYRKVKAEGGTRNEALAASRQAWGQTAYALAAEPAKEGS